MPAELVGGGSVAPDRRPEGVEIVERGLAHDGFLGLEVLQLRHERFDGGWTPVLRRELVRQREAAVILPYDPLRDSVLLVEQFRTGALRGPAGPWLIEAPAGLIEPGETPEGLARRELQEECGLQARRVEHALDYWATPGSSSELVHVFVGEVDLADAGGLHGVAHESEDILGRVLKASEAFEWLDEGKIVAATGVIPLQWLRQHRPALRKRWQEP
jgi:ADP-ribose pyrophosphatase